MQYKDYYRILGVPRDAPQDEIKRSYRRLARKYHPDVSKETDAEARFKEVGEAYEVLKDPQKRAAYDRLGANWKAGQDFRPPPGWEREFNFDFGGNRGGFHRRRSGFSGGEFSDFFENLFGQGSPFGGSIDEEAFSKRRGADRRATLKITLEEAFQGGTRRVDVAGRALQVKIPAGVSEGSQIRLAGQGDMPLVGGPRGDLYLELKIEPHRLFEVNGKDLTLRLPIAPWEAALGGRVPVPTLAGRIELTVPAGSQGGRKLRLKGRGLPGSPTGDLYVELKIVTPPADSEQARNFYRRMAEELAFDPRRELGV
ncbi:DnaJ C-terminal domain-containing protein [Endothiovibrio diazotrophicus]